MRKQTFFIYFRNADAIPEGDVHAELPEHRGRRLGHLQLPQGQGKPPLPHAQQNRQQTYLFLVSFDLFLIVHLIPLNGVKFENLLRFHSSFCHLIV